MEELSFQNCLYSHFLLIIIQFLQKKLMETKPKNLFTKGKSHKLGKIYGKWKLNKNISNVTIQLYEKGLIEVDDTIKTMEFDYDLKYSFNKENLQIKFERGKQTRIYILNSLPDLQNWREILKGKLNQRGFHEQFKPLKKIGKGNFASVYLAQKLQDGQHYAVKAFSKEAAYSEQNGKQCLIKEIQISRCLDHKNTMKLVEVFESENSLYIIFELLSGGQLYDKVKIKYKFKPNQIRQIVYGILKGLQQMHSKEIMHRDLKPQNLLFRKQNEWDCVIADYGLAEFCDIDTYLFVRCGTPGYVAPQVINIKDMNAKYKPICDIYSLGLIFHVLLLGKSAFNGRNYNEVLAQNRAANIDLTGEQYRRLNPDALDLLNVMLKKKPNQRISTEQALHHPYFKEMEQQIKKEQEPIHIAFKDKLKLTKLENSGGSDYPVLDSPLLTTANQRRKLDKKINKDSCVDFHMGKENLLTGKTEEVESLYTNKVSIANQPTPLRKPKVSQFRVQNR